MTKRFVNCVKIMLVFMLIASCAQDQEQVATPVVQPSIAHTQTPVQSSTTTPLQSTPTPSASPLSTATSAPTLTATITVTPTVQPAITGESSVKSIDVMKFTQDGLCQPVDTELIIGMVGFIANAGATHIAISPPLADVECGNGQPGDSLALITAWVDAARAQGLNVWFRMKHPSFNGFYDVPVNTDLDFHTEVHATFILAHPDLFRDGDIYTPNTEPSAGTIVQVNCFPSKGDICIFRGGNDTDSEGAKRTFYRWLVDSRTAVSDAFRKIDRTVRVGYFGIDGYVAWGDRNPDWNDTIPDEMILQLGNELTFDHYFDQVDPEAKTDELMRIYPDDTLLQQGFLDQEETGWPNPYVEFAKIRMHFPDTYLCMGETGAIHGETPEQMKAILEAAYHYGFRCFNYWHLGPGGKEALLDMNGSTLVPNAFYEVVRSFYRSLP